MNTFPPDADAPAEPCFTYTDGEGRAKRNANGGWEYFEVGFTKRERAAIDLKVPDSGVEWLNYLIRESRRLDAMQSACQGILSSGNVVNTLTNAGDRHAIQGFINEACQEVADALLQQGDVKTTP